MCFRSQLSSLTGRMWGLLDIFFSPVCCVLMMRESRHLDIGIDRLSLIGFTFRLLVGSDVGRGISIRKLGTCIIVIASGCMWGKQLWNVLPCVAVLLS
jgi:hypothetical protein